MLSSQSTISAVRGGSAPSPTCIPTAGEGLRLDTSRAAIQAEWTRTCEALALITGESQRLARNPSLVRSIEYRFPYLDPLNHLQVELMRRYREQKEHGTVNERVQRGIHISINGVAAGLRNTG